MATTKYKTRRGFADPSGPDYEYKYASLLFLRGIIHTTRFFLATNMEGIGKFDDIVFVYRQNKKAKACFMQLKHKQNPNYQVPRSLLLDTSGEYSLPLLCESYHKVLNRLPLLNSALGIDVAPENVTVALFTNAKMQGIRGHALRDYLINTRGRVCALTGESDPEIFRHLDNLACYKFFLEQMEDLLRTDSHRSEVVQRLKAFSRDNSGTHVGRMAEKILVGNIDQVVREQLATFRQLENIHNFAEFLAHFLIFHKQECESKMIPLILDEFSLACGMPYTEKSMPFLHFMNSMKTWKNKKDDFKPYLNKKATLWKETLICSLSEQVLFDMSQFGVKFQDVSLIPISRAISKYLIVNVRSDATDCTLTILKVHMALAQMSARHVLVRGSAVTARRSQLLAVWQTPRPAVVVVWLDDGAAAEEVARAMRPVDGRLVLVGPAQRPSHDLGVSGGAVESRPLATAAAQGSRSAGVKRKRSALSPDTSDGSDAESVTAPPSPGAAAPHSPHDPHALSATPASPREGSNESEEERAVVAPLVAQLMSSAVASAAATATNVAAASSGGATTSRHRSRSRRRSSSRGGGGGGGGRAGAADAVAAAVTAGVAGAAESESETDMEEKHERFVRRLERQRPGPARQALWDACSAQLEAAPADVSPGEALLRDECSLRQLRRPPHLLGRPIYFQGQMVTLHELLVSDPRLAHALTGDALAHLLRASEPHAGVAPGPAPDFFVERPLLRAGRASRALLAAVAATPPTVSLLFSGVSTKQLQDALPPGCRAEQLCLRAQQQQQQQQQPEELRFVSINRELADEAMEYMLAMPGIDAVHWFHVDPATMVMHWMRSSPGAIDALRPYLDPVVDRTSALDVQGRVVLVVGKPGLGKSTLVSNVARRLKERDRTTWVVRVNLNSYSSFLDREPMTASRVLQLLLDAATGSAQPNPFEEKFFKHCVTESGKVVVLVDGFDEVCFRHTNQALKLLEELLNTRIQQIWVTSREFLKETLETQLSTFAFTLGGFDETSQRKFFKVFWAKKIPSARPARLEKFIHEFLKIVKMSNLSRQGMHIPLETMMMAEAYLAQAEVFCRKEGLDVAIPTYIDLMDLYQRFVVNKYDIKFRKDEVDSTRAGFDHMFRLMTEEYTRSHELLALCFIFSEAELQQLQPSDVADRVADLVQAERANAHLEKVGIVTRVEKRVPCFVHRTFAEYFAALWLAEHAHENTAFLQEKLFAPEHFDMRFMFDRLLARDSELNRTVLFGDRRSMQACLEGAGGGASRGASRGPSRGAAVPWRLDRGGRAALHLAAAYGRAALVQPLVAAGAFLEQSDAMFGWRPLQWAQHADAWDAAEALLVAGADPAPLEHALNKLSRPEFIATCARGGHIKLLQYAVEAGAAQLAAAVSPCGRSALHVACEAGQSLAVEYLLAAGLSAAAADRDGATPLHLAAARGHTNVVRRLLGCGGEVNATDALRSSPLLVAAAEGHLPTVRTLVESGADVNLPGPVGTTALQWASARGWEELVRYLLGAGAAAGAADAEGCTPLHEAAAAGHVGVAQALLAAGADPDAADAEGLTPLHAAAQRGHAQAVKLLAATAPRSVHARDERGRRPVHLAAAGAHTAAVHVLAQAGADLLATDGDGLLPLHLAARAGHLDLLRLLLDAGCGVNARDSRDQTPLHYAVAAGHEEAIAYLLSANANVMAADNRGWSPVHVAVRHGQIKALNMLYEQGAFVDQEAQCGTTPLHLAAEAGHQEIVRFLVECGADVNHPDKQGRRPVHLAAEAHLVDTTNYLVALGADMRRPDSQAGDRRRGDPDPAHNDVDSLLDLFNPDFDHDIDPEGDADGDP